MSRLDQYVRWFLRRGVPSLCTDLKSLYANKSKVDAIERLFLSFEASLTTENKLPPELAEENKEKEAGEEDGKEALFWVFLFLAQHFDRKRELTKAMAYVEKAIEQTPSVVEAYQVKARILKHSGDYQEAVKVKDESRFRSLPSLQVFFADGAIQQYQSMRCSANLT